MSIWTVHGDGRSVAVNGVVAPDERLSWPRTIGIGAQHIAAMFGATFLVPILTGFPATTTLLFSGIGTLVFLAITRNRVPSYLGSSFAFIAPVQASMANGNMSVALGGIVATGVVLALVGLAVQAAGTAWIDTLLPPVVTGTIVALIGLNLAPVAKGSLSAQPVVGTITLAAILLFAVVFKGFIARISVFLGIVVGYIAAMLLGLVDTSKVAEAKAFALPSLTTPTFSMNAIVLFLPVVLVLIAENVGHVKTVAAMTGRNLDGDMGRALIGDGVATTIAGFGGGSGTTTYAENIGVMAATKVYSTAAYAMAGIGAILLSMSPKLGALLASIPQGVLGGAGIALYGMIGILGARIWVEGKVNFSDPTNLLIAASALVIGISDVTFKTGNYTFNGIVLGTVVAVVGYQVLRGLAKARGTSQV